MRKKLVKSFLIFLLLFLTGLVGDAYSQTMNDYCQAPPFIAATVAPNVLMDIDVSGSMSWSAYNPTSGGWGWCNSSSGCGWTYNGDEEGYFRPAALYRYNSTDGAWEETTGTPETCPNAWFDINTSNIYSGSCLNFLLMSRIDLVRWAMTGGTPASCDGSQRFNENYCDPELWDQPGNRGGSRVGTVCNDSLDVDGDRTPDGGCILRSIYDDLVKVPWSRVYDGLAFQFKNLDLQPRMGVMFYSGGSVRSRKVYIGDFTAPNSTDDQFPYMNLITYINSTPPYGTTPTGPAMWDALNYFAQNDPDYNGFTPQSGAGDFWRNPMYVCEQGGANCEFVPCAKNFVILLSDGQWNYGGGPPAQYTCSIDTGFATGHSADPVVPAYEMHMGFTNAAAGVDSNINAVYTIGLFLGSTGEQSLKNVAMYGSFTVTALNTWPDSLSGYPDNTCWMDDCGNGKGSACEPLPPSSPDWDENNDGVPDTFQSASNATEIKDAILNAVLDILKRASSGTAVSVLASGEGSGANMLQALFYPSRLYGIEGAETEILWTGSLYALWYYISPDLEASNIREDTVEDLTLRLDDDYIVSLYFKTTEGETLVVRCKDVDGDGLADNDGDGICDSPQPTVTLSEIKDLWEAGEKLFTRDPADRTIYTNTDDDSTLDLFSTVNSSILQPLLNAADSAEADWIIEYVRGDDSGRCSNNTSLVCVDDTPCAPAGTCVLPRSRTATLNIGGTDVTNTWKLGDIITSTPKLQSFVNINNYHKPLPRGYDDETYKEFISTNDYQNRGMVYVGANDGMLHAFNLGKLEVIETRRDRKLKARLTGTDLGKEEWAFIPKNALPYLKYMMESEYCHLYYVDASPYLVDASIGDYAGCTGSYWECEKTVDTWRTVLIGSMRLGGACRDTADPCTDCVKTPTSGVGYSSYFALDVTDPRNPELLWEFSHPELGFSTAGPVVVRTSTRAPNAAEYPDGSSLPFDNTNGRWFVVIASGPTGPIDTTAHQFLGKSDQPLRVFVLDLKTGALLRKFDSEINIPFAFGANAYNTTVDTDMDYEDDVIYIGYTEREKVGSEYFWTKGGILRIVTKQDVEPNNWVLSTVIDDIGPLTTSIVKLQLPGSHMMLHFGTGRYFYKTDDPDGRQRLYGLREPCFIANTPQPDDLFRDRIDPACTETKSVNDLVDSTTSPPTLPSERLINVPGYDGWYIKLDCSATDNCPWGSVPSGYNAERLVSNPYVLYTGVVLFPTFSPTASICGYGGNTYVWAIDTETGGAPEERALYGKVLLQLSTGEIRELALSEAFTEKAPSGGGGGRRTVAFIGLPPAEGAAAITSPMPLKKIIHSQER